MAKDRDEELTQLRAEIALLRAQVQEQSDRKTETDAEKAKHAAYLEWIGKTAEERTQLVADKLFPAKPGYVPWIVELKEQPRIRLHAHSEYEAVGRYNQLCGITGTAHAHSCVREEQPQELAAA